MFVMVMGDIMVKMEELVLMEMMELGMVVMVMTVHSMLSSHELRMKSHIPYSH